MYATSGGSRLRAPTSATSLGATEPASIAMRSGIPQALPDGDVSGVLRSPCASNQTTARRPRARGEAADRADVRATAAAEDERPLRQRCAPASRPAPRASPPRRPPPRGTASGEPRRLGHRLAAGAPGARDADEPGGELATAAVALVLGPDRDRGERAAVGAAGAERAHAGPLPRVAAADDVHADPLVEGDGAGRVLGVDAEAGRALPCCREREERLAEERLPETRGATAGAPRARRPNPRRRPRRAGPVDADAGDLVAVPRDPPQSRVLRLAEVVRAPALERAGLVAPVVGRTPLLRRRGRPRRRASSKRPTSIPAGQTGASSSPSRTRSIS